MNMSKIGEFIKNRRDELGMSYRELERASGVSKTYISFIEKGRTKNPPTPEKLAKLAPALRVNYNKLMELANYITPPDDPKYAGIQAVCLTDEYIAKGMTEKQIRQILDSVLEVVNKRKLSK
jgi:transcriptional regulator with XRE-family HTH domain